MSHRVGLKGAIHETDFVQRQRLTAEERWVVVMTDEKYEA